MLTELSRDQHASFDRISRNEANASKHINIVGHYDPTTLIDKSGKLIRLIQLVGLDFVTRPDVFLDVQKNKRNQFLKSLSSNYALYCWTVRSKVAEYPAGEFMAFAKQVNDKYRAKIENTEMYHNTLYLAIITKPPEGAIQKGFAFLKKLSAEMDKVGKARYFEEQLRGLNEVTRKLLNVLSDYQPDVLSVYERHGQPFSQPLELLSYLINAEKSPIPLLKQDASIYLPNKRLFFNRRLGAIELRAADGCQKFAAVIAIKEYTPFTYQGMLDNLSKIKAEYIITQSYRFYDKHMTQGKLRGQQRDMRQSKDESVRQTEQINHTLDEAVSGEMAIGAHHFTILCYADSLEELNRHVGVLIAELSDSGILAVREDISCECAFWAQLPANFSYIARQADISTKNMAAFASLHNQPVGKITGNYWGNAVTVFETQSGSPYYFNFHYKDVGNFLVFGTMGSGITVLVGFLILQSMKFGGKRILFDKDRGLEILVRAMGGTYEILKPGINTGFNPCQLSDTPENRKFLANLFKKMLTVTGNPLTEADFAVIEQAIQGLYRLDQSSRQLRHIAPFFGSKERGSLRARFDQWHSDGVHAWLFDHLTDTLNLNADVIGIDLGHILKAEECKTPALMYLLHRVSQQIEGQRGMMFIDEGWKALEDDYFKDILNDWSRTPRKKNNFLGLATQAAEDTINSAVSKTLNESAACKIFFPNPTADRKVYMNDFGLTEQEYELIKSLSDQEHYFLLNYGHGKESVIIRANLSGLDDEIAVISGRESTLKLLDTLRQEVGDDPAKWLPLFHERRKTL